MIWLFAELQAATTKKKKFTTFILRMVFIDYLENERTINSEKTTPNEDSHHKRARVVMSEQ